MLLLKKPKKPMRKNQWFFWFFSPEVISRHATWMYCVKTKKQKKTKKTVGLN
jgi:hypothetical protein